MSVDGILPNGLLAIVHFGLILIVPLVSPIITFIALSEQTVFQGNIYANPLTLRDFYSTNRLNPWWDNTPYLSTAAYIHLYVIFYLILAYTEVLSFYLTGYDNNGKFNVVYTLPKRFILISFLLSLCFFLYLYFAMLWFALVWAVLAAIFNPSVFLPYTAAALTLIGTFTAKYVGFEKKVSGMKKDIEIVIQEKLNSMFHKSVEKV